MSCKEYWFKTFQSQIAYTSSSPSCIQVLCCAFIAVSSSSNGGAISISVPVSLTMDQDHFLSCKTSSSSCSGGCLYATNLTSCIISRCCAQSCYATSNGMVFEYTMDEDSTNLITLLTINQCAPNQQGNYVILAYGGTNDISYYNSSNCRLATVGATFYIANYYSLTSSYGSYSNSYSSIITEYNVKVSTTTPQSNFSLTNVVNNTQVNSNYGVLYALSSMAVTNCAFISNSFTYTFTTYSSGYIYVSNCAFSSTPSSSGAVSTSIILVTASPSTVWASFNNLANCMKNMTQTMTPQFFAYSLVSASQFLPLYYLVSLYE